VYTAANVAVTPIVLDREYALKGVRSRNRGEKARHVPWSGPGSYETANGGKGTNPRQKKTSETHTARLPGQSADEG